MKRNTILPTRLCVFLAVVFLAGCGQPSVDGEAIDLDTLPRVEPHEIAVFDSVDSLYFSILYRETIAMKDGSVLMGDVHQALVWRLHPENGISELITSKGRGPGEILNVTRLSIDRDENLYVYDQMNRKMLRFREGREFEREFMPEAIDEMTLFDIHPIGDREELLLTHRSMSFLTNPEQEQVISFSVYDQKEKKYIRQLLLPTRRFARIEITGGVSTYTIPYAPDQLTAVHPDHQSFYLYGTDSPWIAQMSLALDTVRVLPLLLPEERISTAERDSLVNHPMQSYRNAIRDHLPEVKAPVDRLLTDERGRLWLKLTHRSETQQWLVLNPDGKPEKVVHFPREGWVTHLSDHHIGIRVDGGTFALYEAVD